MPNKKFVKPHKKNTPGHKKVLGEIAMQGMKLVVKDPFNGLSKGQIVRNFKGIKKILSSNNADKVLKIRS